MLYLTPPTGSPRVHEAIRCGVLGGMATPNQGNVLIAGARYGFDSGCFGKGYPGDRAWMEWLAEMADKTEAKQRLWATAPDVVGDAVDTAKRARPWLNKIRHLGFPAAYVAQNGARCLPWDEFDVLFLGGVLECPSCLGRRHIGDKRVRRAKCVRCRQVMAEWKLSHAARDLTLEAMHRGKTVHMGRVSSEIRIVYAVRAGVDSADGTYLTKGPDINLVNLLRWLDRIDALPEEDALFDPFPEVAHMTIPVAPSMPNRVPAPAGVYAYAEAPIQHRCPFIDESDDGTVWLAWESSTDYTLELQSLAAYLEGFRDMKISHEELTHRIYHDLGVKGVTTRFVTGGITASFAVGDPIPRAAA
ncbi:hypothetical protein [Nocardia sp. CA-120079]|uniref:hypothetical protein n=1 Tax=Nocardia sp. CA-120079 TaxID=3239974 RepID=UPI003D97BA2A